MLDVEDLIASLDLERRSRIEERSDLLLSTLRRTVKAMGGSLSLVASFPDRPPVEIAGIAGCD